MDLQEFFRIHPKTAVAFSGGVDSAYLLYAAARWGRETIAYYVNSPFQPAFELGDARALAKALSVPLRVLPVDILACPQVAENPKDRCYHCKKEIFQIIAARAAGDGFPVVLDGSNASDDPADRPGMAALEELGILSPLRLCGLTKGEIRRLSREAGLFTWDKPAYACLATRIPAGEPITQEKLAKVERAEDYLRELGFSDLRVRSLGEGAKLQLPAAQMGKLLEHRKKIVEELKKDYAFIMLDLEARDA